MLDTALSAAQLLIAGKLFRDHRVVFRQLAIGAGAGAATVVTLGLIAPIWAAAAAGGAVAGFLQPILFKDLKYA